MTRVGAVRAESTTSVTLYGVRFNYIVRAVDTNGSVAIIETEIPPRTLVKPHLHTREDEFSVILSGRLGVRLGDDEQEVEAGTYLVKPRGTPHAIWNPGPEPARLAEILVPGGFESYFEAVEPVLAQSGPEWTKRFNELAEQYGVEVLDDWVKDLEVRHGVKLNPRK
jgi:mannose-6-phosphate isomerase-like protein (cupin superfamily)